MSEQNKAGYGSRSPRKPDAGAPVQPKRAIPAVTRLRLPERSPVAKQAPVKTDRSAKAVSSSTARGPKSDSARVPSFVESVLGAGGGSVNVVPKSSRQTHSKRVAKPPTGSSKLNVNKTPRDQLNASVSAQGQAQFVNSITGTQQYWPSQWNDNIDAATEDPAFLPLEMKDFPLEQ